MLYRGTSTSQGFGLGIFIVSESAIKLSGKIEVFSSPLKGTTFTIKLPKEEIAAS